MKIFVFGNPDVPVDSLPLKILPQLRDLCPGIDFEVVDSNEEWNIERGEASKKLEASPLIVIDTALGIKEVTVFDDLNRFARPPRIGMHDFDALTNLRYLIKIGKIGRVKVIGLPTELSTNTENELIKNVADICNDLIIN